MKPMKSNENKRAIIARDQKLIQKYLSGDQKAFQELYELYNPTVMYVGRSFNLANVEDMASDTWIKILGSLPRYKPESPFGAWVYRIAKNVATDYYRAGKKHPTEPLYRNIAKYTRSPLDDIISNEEAEALWKALYSLKNKRDVKILHDHYVEGKVYREIAESLGISLNTVLGASRRTLKKLRTLPY